MLNKITSLPSRFVKFAIKAFTWTPGTQGNTFLYSWGMPFNWGQTYNGIVAYDNKIVYAGLNLKNRKYTEPDILVSKVKNKQAVQKYYKATLTNEERLMTKVRSVEELDDHPLITLLERPNDWQTGLELWGQFWMNYEYGDGYIIALNDSPDSPGAESRSYKPTKIYAPNKNMVIPQKGTSATNPIEFYRITMYNGDQLTLYPDQVFHMSKWNPWYQDLYGYNFAQAAAKTIARNDQNQIAQGSAFVNGGRGVLFSSDTEKNQIGQVVGKMSGEEMSLLKETMRREMAGAANNRKMNWTNGFVNAQTYGDTLAEMELIDSEKADWKDIYAVLGIPQVLAPTNESSTDATNAQIGYKSLVTNTIIPDLKKRDMKFTRFIQKWYGDDIITVSDITDFPELKPDLELMSKIYGKPPISNDEKRAIFKYDKMEDAEQGEAVLIEGNQKTLQQVMDGGYDPSIVPPDGKQYDYR